MPVIPPDLIAEHKQLKQQFEALEREHAALKKNPHDLAGHAAHPTNSNTTFKIYTRMFCAGETREVCGRLDRPTEAAERQQQTAY